MVVKMNVPNVEYYIIKAQTVKFMTSAEFKNYAERIFHYFVGRLQWCSLETYEEARFKAWRLMIWQGGYLCTCPQDVKKGTCKHFWECE